MKNIRLHRGKKIQSAPSVVARNGTAIAKLTAMKDPAADRSDHSIALERSASYGPRGRKATWEEFLALRDEAEERYEYIDGEIFVALLRLVAQRQK
ncbi:MAG TPA: hypothetical protein VEZ72_08440, partial [Paenibacillus sp.]|nr:hypothetical protein [Paenibacillus sp.]